VRFCGRPKAQSHHAGQSGWISAKKKGGGSCSASYRLPAHDRGLNPREI
jgi:hypothetical protein